MRKPCKYCGKMFLPKKEDSRRGFSKLCESCWIKSRTGDGRSEWVKKAKRGEFLLYN